MTGSWAWWDLWPLLTLGITIREPRKRTKERTLTTRSPKKAFPFVRMAFLVSPNSGKKMYISLRQSLGHRPGVMGHLAEQTGVY